MSRRRVVVTGLGIVSPVGNDVATAWSNILAGRSGIGPITYFDVSAYTTRFGGMIRDFDAKQWLSVKDVKRTDPFRSEEHTSELQSLMRITYAVFCLKKTTRYYHHTSRE